MLAEVSQANDKVIVTMHRKLQHRVEEVWDMLTENEQLAKWFPEMQVEQLKEGGKIKLAFHTGGKEEMTITSLAVPTVLEYTWGQDLVRFDLTQTDYGTHLLFTETLQQVTEQTPKDIAGWHICLDAIEALLDKRELSDPHQTWEKAYADYKRVFDDFEK
ncbi:Uncharacterized conserved protein YndB, AHSA1/START domain [Pisciglobus halotolerans]|uniref:Uncharacterized conserved protein YndB, AHSA1/START domain n=2 Tax=Pisciglobus halotolerans TaxID=745365 RepID=A0A1I3DNU9_9LACT|nr:Uncharacterized conserved protein YndB, AHSA1/START domain [Pisciglobus halotolerans]